MASHPSSEQLHAYHDDRLDGGSRAAIQRHIAECNPCALELKRLAVLSQLLSNVVRPQLSQIVRARLHDGINGAIGRAGERANEMGLIRIGWRLSGIAAAVLVVCSAWLMTSSQSASDTQVSEAQVSEAQVSEAQVTPPWVTAADTATADSEASASPMPATPVAQWYLADAVPVSSDTR